jgi:hypothetical protein
MVETTGLLVCIKEKTNYGGILIAHYDPKTEQWVGGTNLFLPGKKEPSARQLQGIVNGLIAKDDTIGITEGLLALCKEYEVTLNRVLPPWKFEGH